MKRPYLVSYSYQVSSSIEVMADDEDAAADIARQTAAQDADLNDLDDVEIDDIEELDSPSALEEFEEE